MRARMLVDARVVREVVEGRPVETASGESLKEFKVGQEIEGPDAEFQVGLGHAEVIEESPVSSEGESQEVLATQAALDHAEALGVDITAIKGSGKDGKVTKADVEKAVAAKEAS